MTTDVLTIALTLAGFVVGMGIALLYAGARSRSVSEAHTARLHGLQSELTTAGTTAAGLRADVIARTQEAETSAAELKALQSELAIQRAQAEEAEAERGALDDRLSAAEARLLTADALLADRGREVDEWSRAYTLLRATHDALQGEHREAEERHHTLEDDLQEQRLEIAELGAKLEAVQGAAGLQQPTTEDELAGLQQRVTAISLLKATAEAGVRRRELELADVNSKLSALRFSINVLTASAAELAALAGGPLFGIVAPERDESPLPPLSLPHLREAGDPAQAAEELANLEGMIADWFDEVRAELPYTPAVLRALAGAAGYPVLPAAGTSEASGDTAVPAEPAVQPGLPAALKLAAVKAVAKRSLERSADRQFELAARLTESEGDYEALAIRIRAWRAMLYVTLQNDADLLRLLEQQEEGDAAALLSACATVALTAFQKKQQHLRRLEEANAARVAQSAAHVPQLNPPPGPAALATVEATRGERRRRR